MSILSLREINQSQLDTTPVIDGQLIVCLDTGNAYRDSKSAHVKIGSDLEVVGELPLAPLANKLYYLRPDKLYAYNGGDWVLLNDGLNNSAFSVTTSSSKSVDLNLLASNIVKTKVNIAGSGITSIVTNEDGGVVIDTPDPNSLLNTLTNEDIDLITGGYVADDGTTTPPKQVTIDSTLSVSGCAADAKAAGDGITKAQQVANDAAQQIKELKEKVDNSMGVDLSGYVTNEAMTTALAGKADKNHNHDGKYYLKSEVDKKLRNTAGSTTQFSINWYSDVDSTYIFACSTMPKDINMLSVLLLIKRFDGEGLLEVSFGGLDSSISCDATIKWLSYGFTYDIAKYGMCYGIYNNHPQIIFWCQTDSKQARSLLDRNASAEDKDTKPDKSSASASKKRSPYTCIEVISAVLIAKDGTAKTPGEEFELADDNGAIIQLGTIDNIFKSQFDGSFITEVAENGTGGSLTSALLKEVASTVLLAAYPVGSIYMTMNNVSPATMFGGTWERIKDTFILAAGDTYAAGSTGGEATHTLTIDEMPPHSHHQQMFLKNNYSGTTDTWVFDEYGYLFDQSSTVNPTASNYVGRVSQTPAGWSGNAGNSKSHNNMPPYITVYVWRRIV